MEYQVQIYAKVSKTDYKLLDLFDDEDITVKSSVQNIQDIAKVFTDFSQTFTIPASKVNNDVFGYYYNNDLDEFNANIRIGAKIEINRTPFRYGKIQLEGATIKDNQVRDYKITFYGDVVTLKDQFANDKLKDLDYGSLNFSYTGSDVQTTITSTSDLDVRFPLISSERLWSYGDATGTDVATSGGAIGWGELFPALKDKKIIELIESKYGITFTGNFLDNKRFTNSFTYWKNRETPDFLSEPFDLDFDFTGTANVLLDTYAILDTPNQIDLQYIDPYTQPTPADWASWQPGGVHQIKILTANVTPSQNYYVDRYKNGVLEFTYPVENAGAIFNTGAIFNVFGLNDSYSFKLRAEGAMSFDYIVQYSLRLFYTTNTNTTGYYDQLYQVTETSNAVSVFFDFASNAPDMTISDWFSGTLQEFNLTCYPTGTETEYKVEPLPDWYNSGGVVDITPYTITDTIEISRPKLYNEIVFDWQESQSFINAQYKEFNGRNYGSLREVFPGFDGGKYEIKLPFETLLFSNIDTTNGQLQLGYCLTKAPDFKPYIPKPIKLYLRDNLTPVSVYFDNGTTVPELTNYLPFGQEINYNTGIYTMNFGEEFSTIDNLPKSNSLYNEYYKDYLLNLFDSKTRIVTLSCILPIGMLTRLTLDDAIIVRDKKYRINDMTTDLSTGLVKLVLISDWTAQRKRFLPNANVPATGGVIVVPIKPPKGGWINIGSPIEPPFVTSNPTLPATNELEQNWEITVPPNTTGNIRINTITYTGYNPDGTVAFERTIVIEQAESDDALLTESGGFLLTESLDKILI